MAETWDVVVAGGGLAGLVAAQTAARRGSRVLLCESTASLGGRAATGEQAGFRFNPGPHALYRGGEGLGVLAELGIRPAGGIPPAAGSMALPGRRLHPRCLPDRSRCSRPRCCRPAPSSSSCACSRACGVWRRRRWWVAA